MPSVRRGVLALAIAASLASTNVCAQTSATDKATADALFRAGKELLEAGKVAEACAKLAESQRIDPRTGTLLNLASCHEQEGKTASAWAEFNEGAAQAANAKQVDREKYARTRSEELERSLSRLKIVVLVQVPGLEVKVDGKPLRQAVLGTPIPFDPGAHTIEVAAPLKKAWTKTTLLPKGPIEQTIEIPALAEPDAPAAPAPPPPADVKPASSSKVWTATGLALFAGGSAALGAGVFFGVQTFAKRDDAEASCIGTLCPQRALDTYGDARTSATASTILVAVGVLMMGAGAYLVLFPPNRSSSTSVAASPAGIGGRW